MCVPDLKKIGGESHGGAHRGDVFILAGDGPLIRGEVLKTLLQAHHEDHAVATTATAVLDDPTGYGRIVRDAEGNFIEIVEQLDATPEQREIREVFPSYYCCRIDDLLFALSKLTNNNKKGEFYLTDIFSILRKAGRRVAAVQAVAADDVIGVNTRQQLAEVDAIMQERIQRHLREAGVTIVSPITTYLESGASIGTDTVLQPFTFIGRDSSVGRDCTVGPFACLPRESILPDGASVAGNVTVEMAMLNRSGS
jgi:bifunctional UDP-N-acetylglucosamine pyrophosphorylase/glucosamine-1-phosphate N-acetyltransferase